MFLKNIFQVACLSALALFCVSCGDSEEQTASSKKTVEKVQENVVLRSGKQIVADEFIRAVIDGNRDKVLELCSDELRDSIKKGDNKAFSIDEMQKNLAICAKQLFGTRDLQFIASDPELFAMLSSRIIEAWDAAQGVKEINGKWAVTVLPMDKIFDPGKVTIDHSGKELLAGTFLLATIYGDVAAFIDAHDPSGVEKLRKSLAEKNMDYDDIVADSLLGNEKKKLISIVQQQYPGVKNELDISGNQAFYDYALKKYLSEYKFIQRDKKWYIAVD